MRKSVVARFSTVPTLVAILVGMFAWSLRPALAAVQRVKFQSGNHYLLVEFLDNDLVHFELSALGPGPSTSMPIFTTPQVAKTDYTGPSSFTQSGNTLETPEMRVAVDAATLCVTTTDKMKNLQLTTLCPLNLTQAWKGFTLTPGSMQHTYGLGEQFITPGNADVDWTGRVKSAGDTFGNQMVGFNGGANGNAQIPVLYVVGPNNGNYGLFLDQVYKQRWDFTVNPWQVEMWGDQIRWYIMTGPHLPDLRQDYMELTGRPPVPPKQAFGMWVSEYGYDNWAEIDGKLSTLRTNTFPIDGFVLDLQWFGGVTVNSDNSNMGRLTWDTTNFPNAATKLTNYKNNDGISLILIEESYISKNRPEHADMQSRGYLVREGCSTCAPVYIHQASGDNAWWGQGGMMDWTQDAAGDYWHDLKRQPLINDGVLGHWIDLGEPEIYHASDWTGGILPNKHAHADYHNMYAFKWAQSIARGYTRNSVTRRPFLLSRSGAAGIQRFGAAMWSADIASRLSSLATHMNAQMHMSMAGIDYFGSDIRGFHWSALDSDLNELYTQWFANGMMVDVPSRPHTENLCNCRETAPDRVGDMASNLANVRQRYELIPYMYSLAHRAYLYGEPVVPPLVYYYQNDNNVREMGHEKLVGRDLLVGMVASAGERQRGIYLPVGDWVNYHTNQWFHSTGQWYNNQPEYVNGVFRLPTYARAGAIIPKMHIDDKSMNALGKRTDGTTRTELIARVYSSTTSSDFTLYEDDGETTAYQRGSVRTTALTQQGFGTTATVTIGASSGTYTDAPSSRATVVELVSEETQASAVTLNGSPLTQHANKAAFDAAASGWYNAGGNLSVAKSASLSVTSPKTFVFTLGQTPVSQNFICNNGTTALGQSVYVVGNVPQLGNWSPASAVKLNPTAYPTWSGTISHLPPNTAIEWKCIKRKEANYPANADQWEPGTNNTFTTPASGSGGTTTGDF